MCMLCQDGGYAPFHLPKKHQLTAGGAGDGFLPEFEGLELILILPKPVYTLAGAVNELRTNWGASESTRSWSGDTVYYHIATGATAPDDFGNGDAAGYNAAMMTPFKAGMAAISFEMWDDLIAINLEPTTATSGNIITMAYTSTTELLDDPPEVPMGEDPLLHKTYAVPSVSRIGDTSAYNIDAERIWLATDWWTHDEDEDIVFGSYGFMTYLHEVGHTLGLSHSGNYNGSADYVTDAEYAQDSRQYTVMSYFGGWQDTDRDGIWTFTPTPQAGFGTKNPDTPMLYDVAAIQAIYDPDMHTREGHTTYGFNSTADRDVYDFTTNRDPILTIWDGNGIDTLDASGWTFVRDQVINLNPGTFSSIGRLVDNVAIAFGCDIENAVGGLGDDTIIGNRLDNFLRGGRGADTLDGGEGNDTMDGGLGADIMRGGRGNDIYVVNLLTDTVTEFADGGTDKVIAKISGYTLPNHVENGDVGMAAGFTLRGNELANTLTGNIGDDFLFGGDLGDTLDGGMGNDHLYGGSGNDIMRGGFGNDNFFVDSLGDQVRENVAEGTDAVYVTVNNYLLPINVENGFVNAAAGLALNGNGANNVLTGYSGVDTLHGGLGQDELHGGGNGDRLNGGADRDILFGEAGLDTFIFRRGEANLDTVMDFDGAGALGGDRFEFHGYGAGATFFALDATHWLVNSADGRVHETITLANAASVHWSDFAFIG